MNYNVRIDDNFLKADHSDGEVLQHTDLNELESVVKTAINANYLDIQKLEDGTKSVSGATSLKGANGVATLSQFVSESLQPSDNKIPSSLQVKNFVENVVNTANTGLVFYWDGTGGQEGANIFNQICSKYDNNGKFVFYGKFVVDVGYDNPVFACLEINYGDADEDPTGEACKQAEKALTFYQLDLGLNHVIRKWSEPTERTANLLARGIIFLCFSYYIVPGVDGPGGVLVFAENWVIYRNENKPEIRCPIPRRELLPENRGTLIVACDLYQQKVNSSEMNIMK